MLEQAQNVKDSYVESKRVSQVCIWHWNGFGEIEHESCHGFIFEINFLQDFEFKSSLKPDQHILRANRQKIR